jgi:hypothetical protein
MAGRICTPHRHGIAGLEAGAHVDSWVRLLMSAMRRPNSSVVMTPRSTSARVIEAIQLIDRSFTRKLQVILRAA